MRSLLLACALGAALLGPGEAAASTRSAAALRTDLPPVIDGVLDDPAWREAVPLDPMIQVEPVEGPQALALPARIAPGSSATDACRSPGSRGRRLDETRGLEWLTRRDSQGRLPIRREACFPSGPWGSTARSGSV
jgi:hypothetical protein